MLSNSGHSFPDNPYLRHYSDITLPLSLLQTPSCSRRRNCHRSARINFLSMDRHYLLGVVSRNLLCRRKVADSVYDRESSCSCSRRKQRLSFVCSSSEFLLLGTDRFSGRSWADLESCVFLLDFVVCFVLFVCLFIFSIRRRLSERRNIVSLQNQVSAQKTRT